MILFLGFLFTLFMFALIGFFIRMPVFFIDMPSFLLICIPLVFFLIISGSGKIIKLYITMSFRKNHEFEKNELISLSVCLKRTIRFLIAIGCFGFLTGIIACLANLGSPELLGPNLAISLLTLIYSLSIGFFIFFPVQAWADNKVSSFIKHTSIIVIFAHTIPSPLFLYEFCSCQTKYI